MTASSPQSKSIDYVGTGWPAGLSVVRSEEDLVLPAWAEERTHSTRHLLDGLRGRWRWLPSTKNTLALSGGLAILNLQALPPRYSVAFIGVCPICRGQISQATCQHCRENGIISEVVLVDSAAPDGPFLRGPGYVARPEWAKYRTMAHKFDGRASRLANRIAEGSRPPGAPRPKGEGRIAWGRRLLMAVERFKQGKRGPVPMEIQEIQSIAQEMLERQEQYTRRLPKSRKTEKERPQ